MKAISVYVSDKTYAEFKRSARQAGRPAAELIREAMEWYRDNRLRAGAFLTELPVSSKPKLRRPWTRGEIQEELLG